MSSVFSSSKKQIKQFVNYVKKHTSVDDGNLLSLATGEWNIYIDFLEIVYNKHQKIAVSGNTLFKQFIELSKNQPNGAKMTSELMKLSREQGKIGTHLRLGIESFYLFDPPCSTASSP